VAHICPLRHGTNHGGQINLSNYRSVVKVANGRGEGYVHQLRKGNMKRRLAQATVSWSVCSSRVGNKADRSVHLSPGLASGTERHLANCSEIRGQMWDQSGSKAYTGFVGDDAEIRRTVLGGDALPAGPAERRTVR
jgi:hypothetical protein